MNDFQHKMVQYSVWANCCNNCDFCLRMEREPYSFLKQLRSIKSIRENMRFIDWENEFSYGISLLGGELYYIKNPIVQKAFIELIQDVIDLVLKKSKNPNCRYSSVTNGLYDPKFLFKVIDMIKDQVGMDKVDINFSYDLKHRYKNERDRLIVLENINKFHDRYDYGVGVQMIMTQHLINQVREGKFNITDFETNQVPGCTLSFLYPHPIHTGIELDDFFFSRADFLWFIRYLRENNYKTYFNFLHSTKNSAVFKYTGFRDRDNEEYKVDQQPVLSDGKEVINQKCGHSVLYKCYNDSDKCILCDLKAMEPELR